MERSLLDLSQRTRNEDDPCDALVKYADALKVLKDTEYGWDVFIGRVRIEGNDLPVVRDGGRPAGRVA